MKAAIVEDDADLADNLRTGLGSRGIEAVAITDASRPDLTDVARSVDVVVLDLMLGVRDGIDVCRELRRAGVGTPVLMLTAKGSVADRVRGLEAGADDYLVKPFALEELVARMGALVRRRTPVRGAVLEVGGLTLDTGSGTASAAGRPLRLTERETAVLQFLVLNLGRTVSQQQIYEQLWTFGSAPSSNLVEVYVGRLRRKLAEAGVGVSITTLKQLGYRLELTGGGPAEAAGRAPAGR